MSTKKRTRREEKRYWLSYDLGLRGNYDSLYEWLDSKEAKECGDSIATFISDRTPDEMLDDLTASLGVDKKVRLYLITGGGGKFLVGKRKAAPWAGYFEAAVENVMDN